MVLLAAEADMLFTEMILLITLVLEAAALVISEKAKIEAAIFLISLLENSFSN